MAVMYGRRRIGKTGAPKCYFSGNGLLNLLLFQKDATFLENTVATHLRRAHHGELFFLKSAKTSVDVDYFMPDDSTAIQVFRELPSVRFDHADATALPLRHCLAADECLRLPASSQLVEVAVRERRSDLDTSMASLLADCCASNILPYQNSSRLAFVSVNSMQFNYDYIEGSECFRLIVEGWCANERKLGKQSRSND